MSIPTITDLSKEGLIEDEERGLLYQYIVGNDICKTANLRFITIPPNKQFESHDHKHLQVFYFLSGEGVIIVDEKEIQISKSLRVVVKPFQEHSIKNTGEHNMDILVFDEFDECYKFSSPYVDF